MSGRVGSITTDIIEDGLVFNVDAANRVSYPKTGTTVTDTINNNIGTLSGNGGGNNTPQWENTNSGIFDFDGTDDRITFDASGDHSDVGPNNTCNIWVKYDTTTLSVLVGGASYSSGGYFFYAGPSSAYSSYKGSYDQGTWTSFGTGVWINYCVTKNDSGNVVWYGNGQQLATGNVNAGNSIGFWSIGSYSGGGFTLNGNIANMQVYNRVLSAGEVLHNYNALKGRFGL